MKKILLLLIIITSLGFNITNAQNPITFSHDGVMLEDTITIWIDPLVIQSHSYEINVHNNTNNGINTKIAREIIQDLSENSFTFCWGSLCYGPTVDTSANYLFIQANGQTSDEEMLTADYTPQGNIGMAVVKYTAFNKDFPDTKGSVVIKYWTSPEGIQEDAMKGGSISDAYPNPASNFITLDYQLTSKVSTASIKIFNVLGSTVKKADLVNNNGKLKMNVSDLDNGIYFYSVFINGEIYTSKKLIIRK